MDLSGALWCALALKAEGGTAGIVEWLLDRRAVPWHQSMSPGHPGHPGHPACVWEILEKHVSFGFHLNTSPLQGQREDQGPRSCETRQKPPASPASPLVFPTERRM